MGSIQLNPNQVRLIDNGAKFTGPEALKRIKEGAPFLTNSQIAPIMANREFFNKLPDDVKKELWSNWLLTRTFVAKSDKPFGEKIVYSYEGYSITAIIGKTHQGSPYTLASELTPNNFNLELKNGGKDAVVERKEDSILSLELVSSGTWGKANASTLYLPVKLLDDKDAIDQYNSLPKGDAAGLVARVVYGYFLDVRLDVDVLRPSCRFGGFSELPNVKTSEASAQALAELSTPDLIAFGREKMIDMAGGSWQEVFNEMASRLEKQ